MTRNCICQTVMQLKYVWSEIDQLPDFISKTHICNDVYQNSLLLFIFQMYEVCVSQGCCILQSFTWQYEPPWDLPSWSWTLGLLATFGDTLVGLALESSLPSCMCSVTQLCLTPCNPMDCSPPDSSVHGILQARILEGVANSFSRGPSQPRDWTHMSWISCIHRWILYHYAIWEAQATFLWGKFSLGIFSCQQPLADLAQPMESTHFPREEFFPPWNFWCLCKLTHLLLSPAFPGSSRKGQPGTAALLPVFKTRGCIQSFVLIQKSFLFYLACFFRHKLGLNCQCLAIVNLPDALSAAVDLNKDIPKDCCLCALFRRTRPPTPPTHIHTHTHTHTHTHKASITWGHVMRLYALFQFWRCVIHLLWQN